jgi:hypothetical protein
MTGQDLEIIRLACTLGYTEATNQTPLSEVLNNLEQTLLKYKEELNCPKCGDEVKEEPGLCGRCV